MPTIEQRVVEMRFDNDQFERGVGKSLGTLDKLNKSLELEDASKGLRNIQNQAKGFNLAGMDVAINSVTQKFSALEIAGITAIQNLANRGVNMLTRFAKSVSFDQIAAGWSKYADKTSSVQTIMAATAKDFKNTSDQMEVVNEQLDKLNWFTDETSYNFLEMVNNIGKFTSNNIALDKSVTSMQGIATWAAISGANAGEASRAMYNLSQAMATGVVQLIDWKSIENANMATAEFKQMVIDTAVAQGQLKKSADGVVKTVKGTEVSVSKFNSTLSEKWFTDKILLSTLDKYGDFTNELYNFVNDFNLDQASDAIEMIEKFKLNDLDLSEAANKTGKSVKDLEKSLKKLSSSEMDLGFRAFKAAQEAKTFGEAIGATADAVSTGWMNTFEAIFGDYQEAKKLWTGFANALYDIFASGAERRNEMLEEWHNAEIGGYKDMVAGLSDLWEGINNLIKPLKNAWEEIFPYLSSDQLAKGVANFKTFAEQFKGVTKSFSDIFEETGFHDKTLLNQIAYTFSEVDKRVDKTKDKFGSLQEAINKLGGGSVTNEYFDKLANTVDIPKNLIKAFVKSKQETGKMTKKLKEFDNEAEENAYYLKQFEKLLNKGKVSASDFARQFYGSTDSIRKSSRQLQSSEGDLKKYTDTSSNTTKLTEKANKVVKDRIRELSKLRRQSKNSADALETFNDIYSANNSILRNNKAGEGSFDGLSEKKWTWIVAKEKLATQGVIDFGDNTMQMTDTATRQLGHVARAFDPALLAARNLRKEIITAEGDISKATDTTSGKIQQHLGMVGSRARKMKDDLQIYTDAGTNDTGRPAWKNLYQLEVYGREMPKTGSRFQKFTGQMEKFTDTGSNGARKLNAFQKALIVMNRTVNTYSRLNTSIEPFKPLTETERLDRFKDIVTALFFTIETGVSIFKNAYDAVKQVGKYLFDKLVPIFDLILDKIAEWSRGVSDFMYGLQANGTIVKFFSDVRDKLIGIIEYVFDLMHNLRISEGVQRLVDSIKRLMDRLSELKDKILKKLKGDVEQFDIGGIAKTIADNFVKYLSVAAGMLSDFIDGIIDAIDWLVSLYNQFIESKAFKTFEKGMKRVSDAFAVAPDLWKESESLGDFLERFYMKLVGAGTHAHVIAPIFNQIGKTFRAFGHVIAELLNQIPGFEQLTLAIHSFFDTFDANPNATFKDALQAAFDIYGINIDDIIGNAKAKFEEIKEKIKNFINGVIESLPPEERTFSKIAIAVIKKAFELLVHVIGDFVQKLPDMLSGAADTGGNIIQTIFKGIADLIGNQLKNPDSFFGGMLKGISSFWDFILDRMLAWDGEKAGNLMKKGGLAGLLTLLFNFVTSLSKGMQGLGSIPGAISGVLKSLSGVFKSYSKELNAEALLKISKAIGIFVLAMIGLSFLQPEDLSRVTGSMIVIMGMIALIMSIVAKMKGNSDNDDKTIGQKLMAPISGFIDNVKETIGKYAKIAGVGVMVFKIAKAIKLVAKTLQMFAKMKFLDALKALGILVATSYILYKLVDNLAKIPQLDDKFGSNMLMLGASLYILASALKKIGKMDFWDAVQGLAGIGALMFMMVQVSKTLSGYDLSGVGSSLILMSLALNLLTIPLTVLGLLPFWSVAQGLLALVVAIGAMTAAAIFLANNFGAIDALKAMALAMVAISFPLMALGSMAKESVIGLVVFVAALGAMVGAAYLLGGMSLILNQLALSFIFLSIAALGFGGAAFLLAKAFEALANGVKIIVQTFPLIVDAIIAIGDGIKNHTGEFVAGVATIIAAIALGIMAAKGTLVTTIVSVLQSLLGAITSNLPMMLATIAAGLFIIIAFLNRIAPGLIDSLVKLVVSIIKGIAKGIRDNTEPLLNAIAQVVDAILDFVIEAVAGIVDDIGAHKLADKIRSAKDLWAPAAEDAAEATSDALVDGANADGMKEKLQDSVEEELLGLEGGDAATQAGENIGEDVGNGVDTGFEQYMQNWDIPDSMQNGFRDMFGKTTDLSQTGGFDMGEGWNTGLENYFNGDGAGVMSGIFTGAVGDAGDAGSAEASTKGEESGGCYVTGVDKGVRNGEDTLYNAGWYVADTLDKGYRARSMTESPSKVAIENGEYYDEGLAIGVLNKMGVIKNAGEKTADTVMNSMRSIIGRISRALDDEMDLNPTITPVLDLSNVQNGTSALGGLFGRRSLYLAGNAGGGFEANRLAALNRIEATTTNADVVAALGLLRGDVNNLNDSFSNTAVVLDSGALVGATAKQMDNALGRFKVLKGRGI